MRFKFASMPRRVTGIRFHWRKVVRTGNFYDEFCILKGTAASLKYCQRVISAKYLWTVDNVFCCAIIPKLLCIGVRGVGLLAPRLANSKTLFWGQAQVAQKSWSIKNISNTTKNFRASASCSKIQNDKKYICNTVNSGKTDFHDKRKLL